jgi:prevent-host-death family protein
MTIIATMKNDYTNLLSFEFVPLSEAKAKLSEQIRKTNEQSKRVAITLNGKPAAVLLSYPDFLALLQATQGVQQEFPERVIDFEGWKKDQKRRLQVRDSILRLFDVEKLSRKGQKSYKQETVREFDQKIKK